MRIIINLAATISLFVISSVSFAQNYNSHKSMTVNTLPMQYELAQKVIPVVRTFISSRGHFAHVKGSNQVVVVSKPETYRILQEIFSSLTLANFGQAELRFELEKQLRHSHSSSLARKVIDINNIDPKVLIPALRTLVSKEGRLAVLDNGHQIEIVDHAIYVEDIASLILKLDSATTPKA